MNALKNLILGTAVLTVGALVALPTNVSAAANNGTLKVHEQGTSVAFENNDPKVCHFNFEGFNFDQGQSGVVVISIQGGKDNKKEVKRVDLPPANANGYLESAYITLPNGHYDMTAYGKSTNGSIDYKMDLKSKSKVIKVECDVKPNTPATPVDVITTPGGSISGTTTTAGTITPEAASTVKGAATLPERIPETGGNPLQMLFNTLFAGLGTYNALLRRK